MLGVPIDQIFGALQLFMGSQYVNDFNYANRTYRVYLQAAAPFRDSPDDIGSYYVRSEAGQLIPLEAFTRVSTQSAPQLIRRYNLFRAAEVNGKGAPGVSSGQAMQAMEELAAGTLPEGMTFGWTGLSREEQDAGSQTLLMLGLGLAFVFLVLAAQYESFRLPFVIILAVPLAVLGGLGFQLVRGLTNDVFCQVGLVMLIGLAAKNAILIVEFAEQKRRAGRAGGGRGGRGGGAAAAADPDDVHRVLARRGSAAVRLRRRRGGAHVDRHGRLRRYAGLDAGESVLHAGPLPRAARPPRARPRLRPAAGKA